MRAAAIVLMGLAAAAASAAEPEALGRFRFERAEMGVPFRITLYARDEAFARKAADAAFERVEGLNAVLSDYEPDSELNRLSASAGKGVAVKVSADVWRVLALSQEMARRSEGAFDITIGPLVELWRRARRQRELPAAAALVEARGRVGFGKLRLDAETQSAELLVAGMRLDVGGIAKGYAVDEALKVLAAHGVKSALVAASGDIGASGAPPGQRGWRIEVAALDSPDAPAARHVWLCNSAVSTAGDAFQRVEIGGVRYSHIIDPRTGNALTDHSLATVLGPDCTTTDSLETTVDLLGPGRGLRLIEATPGTAAYVVRRPGDQVEAVESKRWGELAGESGAP